MDDSQCWYSALERKIRHSLWLARTWTTRCHCRARAGPAGSTNSSKMDWDGECIRLLTSSPPVGAANNTRLVSLVEKSRGIRGLFFVTAAGVLVDFSVIGSPLGQTASGLKDQPCWALLRVVAASTTAVLACARVDWLLRSAGCDGLDRVKPYRGKLLVAWYSASNGEGRVGAGGSGLGSAILLASLASVLWKESLLRGPPFSVLAFRPPLCAHLRIAIWSHSGRRIKV